MKKDISNARNAEIVAVRCYLENDKECRRKQLLNYFDDNLCNSIICEDKCLCCDVYASIVTTVKE